MSTKPNGKPAKGPKAAEPPKAVTLDREWLNERLGWLDLDHIVINVIKHVNELSGRNRMAVEEGKLSDSVARFCLMGGLEAEHDAVASLGQIIEGLKYFESEMREAMSTPTATGKP